MNRSVKFLLVVAVYACGLFGVIDSLFANESCKRSRDWIFESALDFQHGKMRARNVDAKRLLEKAKTGKDNLRVLTFNTGLLHRLFGLASVPEYTKRSQIFLEHLGNYLRKHRPTVVTLQELWNMKDVNALRAVIKANNYEMYVAEEKGNANTFGLVTLVDRGMLEIGSSENIHHPNAAPRLFTERLARLKKGFFPVAVNLRGGRRLLIINAHFTYSSKGTNTRLEQAAKLSEFIREQKANFDYVVLGVDTNSSDIFPEDFDALNSDWFLNKEVYLKIARDNQEFEFTDTYRVINDDPGLTQDPRENDVARYGPTTKDEPPQRLDFIWIGRNRDTQNNFYVSDANKEFHSPIMDASGKEILLDTEKTPGDDVSGFLYLSDHFGVSADVSLFHSD